MIMAPADDKRTISPLDAPLQMTTAALELCTLKSTDDNHVRVGKPKWLMPSSPTPVLVRCSTQGLIVITPYDKPLNKRLCLAARVVYDSNPGQTFNFLVANLTGSPVYLPKRMNIALAQEMPDMVVVAESLAAPC